MSSTTYLILANSSVWLGIAGYIVFLATRSANLKKRAQQIQLLEDSNDG